MSLHATIPFQPPPIVFARRAALFSIAGVTAMGIATQPPPPPKHSLQPIVNKRRNDSDSNKLD